MQRKSSSLKFGLVLGAGALLALVLCVQCVRTYVYTNAVLISQEAEHEAARQAGAVSAAARNSGITNPRSLGPVIERTLDAAADRVVWMRVLDLNSKVLAEAGHPEGAYSLPKDWWDRVERHESSGKKLTTSRGDVLEVMLPLRMPHPPFLPQVKTRFNERPMAYVLDVAISPKSVAGEFAGLRENLILGLIASIALLVSLAVIGLRAPHYLRGKYLENELQLAKRVQRNLQPKPQSVSPFVEFAACAMAADHVGGDFYDVFEAESERIAIVLGDVSGKGVPAALLVSVLQGAIRSSTAPQHEVACGRINRMLCEQTAGERFATLFWGVFDPSTNELRYVNAGHPAPMLMKRNGQRLERLREGGPVLGLLSNARYSAGTVTIEDGDQLVVYSDGSFEASNQNDEEFGEARLAELVLQGCAQTPKLICQRIVQQVDAFASSQIPQDDRTLLVVKLSPSKAALSQARPEEIGVAALARFG